MAPIKSITNATASLVQENKNPITFLHSLHTFTFALLRGTYYVASGDSCYQDFMKLKRWKREHSKIPSYIGMQPLYYPTSLRT
jgi:hypothetical protein